MTLLPDIFRTHPGYAQIMATEVFAHLGLGFSALFGEVTGASWAYFGVVGGPHVVGILHLVLAVTILAGAYGNWKLARVGFLGSLSLYLLQVGLFGTAWLAPASAAQPNSDRLIYSIVLAGMSAAAVREPVIPGNYSARDAVP